MPGAAQSPRWTLWGMTALYLILLLVPPLPLHCTSAMGLNCRGAVSSTESNAAEPQPFLILQDGTYLGRRLDLSLHAQREAQFPTSLPTYPPLPPNPLVAPSVCTYHTVFYSLSVFSCLLPFPLRKCFIKEFFSREEVFS